MEHSREYFKNSPWGNLSLDRTFLSYNTLPLVFSLRDTMGNHYLCACVSWHPDYEWLVVEATTADLISLINDSTTLSTLLTAKGTRKMYCKWPEQSDSSEFYECEQFPIEILPQKDVYLELNQDDFKEYVLRLQQEQHAAGRSYKIFHIPKIMVPVYRIQIGPIACSTALNRNTRFERKNFPHPKKGYWFSVEQKYDTKILRLPY